MKNIAIAVGLAEDAKEKDIIAAIGEITKSSEEMAEQLSEATKKADKLAAELEKKEKEVNDLTAQLDDIAAELAKARDKQPSNKLSKTEITKIGKEVKKRLKLDKVYVTCDGTPFDKKDNADYHAQNKGYKVHEI